MTEVTTIRPFRQSVADPLIVLAREGERLMLADVLKAEADAFVASYAHEQPEDGHQRIVRHGFIPDWQIHTGGSALWMPNGLRCATGWRHKVRQKRSA